MKWWLSFDGIEAFIEIFPGACRSRDGSLTPHARAKALEKLLGTGSVPAGDVGVRSPMACRTHLCRHAVTRLQTDFGGWEADAQFRQSHAASSGISSDASITAIAHPQSHWPEKFFKVELIAFVIHSGKLVRVAAVHHHRGGTRQVRNLPKDDFGCLSPQTLPESRAMMTFSQRGSSFSGGPVVFQ